MEGSNSSSIYKVPWKKWKRNFLYYAIFPLFFFLFYWLLMVYYTLLSFIFFSFSWEFCWCILRLILKLNIRPNFCRPHVCSNRRMVKTRWSKLKTHAFLFFIAKITHRCWASKIVALTIKWSNGLVFITVMSTYIQILFTIPTQSIIFVCYIYVECFKDFFF